MSKKKGKKNGKGDGAEKMAPFKTLKNEKSPGLGTFAEAATGHFGDTQNSLKNGNGKEDGPDSALVPVDNLDALKGIKIPESDEVVPEVSEEQRAEATVKIEETKELARNIGASKIQKKQELAVLEETIVSAPEGWELLPDGNPVKENIVLAGKKIVEIKSFLAKVGEFDGTVVGEQVKFAELNAEIQFVTENEADNKARVLTMCGKITDTGRVYFLDWEKEKDKAELNKLRKEHGGFPAGSVLSPWGVYISKRGDDGPSGGQKALESNFRAMMDAHKKGIPFRMKSRGKDGLSDLFKKGEKFVYIYVPEYQPKNGRKVREGHVLVRKFDSSEDKNEAPRWDLRIAESFGSATSLTKAAFPFFWLTKGFPAAKKGALSDEEWHAFSRAIKVIRSAVVADEKANSALEKADEKEKANFEAFKKKKVEKDALQKQRQVEGKIFAEYGKLKDAGELPEDMNWKKFLMEAEDTNFKKLREEALGPKPIPDPLEEINVALDEPSVDGGLPVPKEIPVPEAQMVLSAPVHDDESDDGVQSASRAHSAHTCGWLN